MYLETRSHNKNSPSLLVMVISPVNFSCLSFLSDIFLKGQKRDNAMSTIGVTSIIIIIEQ